MKRLLLCAVISTLSLSASATISQVQSQPNWSCSGTSCAATFTSNPTPRNLVVVWVFWQSTNSVTATVADNLLCPPNCNTYLSAVGPTLQPSASTPTGAQIFYAKNYQNSGSHSVTVTVTFSGSVTSAGVVIVEYSGADTMYPLDSVSAGYSTASNPTGLLDSGNVAPANSNLMVFGAGIADNTSTAMVAGGGFTSLQASHGSWGTGIVETSTAQVTGNSSLQRATACIGTGLPCTAADWVMQMAVFRDASWTVQGGWSPVRPGGIRYADQFPGVDIGDQINHAISDLPSTGGEVFVACGTYSLATQISVTTKTVWLHGCGTKGTANVGTHQTTTLNWKGGANQVILVSGTPAQGSKISGIAFDNHGTGTVAIDVDAGAGEIKIEDVGIVQPNTPFSAAGIRLGNTGSVAGIATRDVSMYSAAPIGVYVGQLTADLAGGRIFEIVGHS